MATSSEESGPNSAAMKNNTGDPKELPVSSSSPPYPKHRDAVIICSAILVVVLVFAGAYLVTRSAPMALPDFIKKPFGTLSTLFSWPDIQEKCESYVRQNERRFSHLGRPLRFSLIKQEINVSNGEKTAKITAAVQGPSGTNTVYFLLERRDGDWTVTSAVLKHENGRYEMLGPG